MTRKYEALAAAAAALRAVISDGTVSEPSVDAARRALRRALKTLENDPLYRVVYAAIGDLRLASETKDQDERRRLVDSAEAHVGAALGQVNAAEGRT